MSDLFRTQIVGFLTHRLICNCCPFQCINSQIAEPLLKNRKGMRLTCPCLAPSIIGLALVHDTHDKEQCAVILEEVLIGEIIPLLRHYKSSESVG